MQLHRSDIEITERTAVQLFNDGIKADATRYDYTNKLKKVLCEYLGPILKGEPAKVEHQKKTLISPRKESKILSNIPF